LGGEISKAVGFEVSVAADLLFNFQRLFVSRSSRLARKIHDLFQKTSHTRQTTQRATSTAV